MFKSEDKSIRQIFQDADYVIPAYQREYVWGPEQVRALLNDVVQNALPAAHSDDRYYIGTMITSQTGNVLEIVDGQQRMTTMALIIGVIVGRHLVAEGPRGRHYRPLERLLLSFEDDGEPRHRIGLCYGGDDVREVMKALLDGRIGDLVADTARFPDMLKKTQSRSSAYNLVKACAEIQAFLDEDLVNLSDDPAVAAMSPLDVQRHFLSALLDRVQIVRIVTDSVQRALVMFETMNNRGLSLDFLDLVKNLIFMKADDRDYALIGDSWREMKQSLKEANEFPSRFLRYLVYSDFGSGERIQGVTDSGIYGWLRDHMGREGATAPGSSALASRRPLDLAQTLRAGASRYAALRGSGKPFHDFVGHPSVERILLISSSNSTFMVPLMAARNLDGEAFDFFAEELEKHVFVEMVAGARHSTREADFVRWAVDLRAMRSKADLLPWLKAEMAPRKNARAAEFVYGFERLSWKGTKASKTRYALSKMNGYVQARSGLMQADFWGLEGSRPEIEHVFPRTPSEGALRESGPVPPHLVDNIGNLVLLDGSLNKKISNSSFSEKRDTYRERGIVLLQMLAKAPPAGNSQHALFLQSLARDYGFRQEVRWTAQSIEARASAMARLACTIWGVDLQPRSTGPEAV